MAGGGASLKRRCRHPAPFRFEREPPPWAIKLPGPMAKGGLGGPELVPPWLGWPGNSSDGVSAPRPAAPFLAVDSRYAQAWASDLAAKLEQALTRPDLGDAKSAMSMARFAGCANGIKGPQRCIILNINCSLPYRLTVVPVL